MTPERIILVRHGRSEANEDATMYSRVPDYKISLVEQGREEARTAGRKIVEVIGDGALGVYVSPYLRTMQTGSVLNHCARVLLRPWCLNDADALFLLASDAKVACDAGFPAHVDINDSRRVIREILTAPECYAIVLRESNAAVGCIQLFTKRGRSVYEADCLEIGYWLGRPYWGAGLMTEAVATICRHCFGSRLFKASKIVAKVRQDNIASKRVLEKSGFVLERNGEMSEYRIWRGVQ